MRNETTMFDFITFNETVLAQCDEAGLDFDAIPQEDWDWLYEAAEEDFGEAVLAAVGLADFHGQFAN